MDKLRRLDMMDTICRQLQCHFRGNILRLLPAKIHPDRNQWQSLSAYRELIRQIYARRPFTPEVPGQLWINGRFEELGDRPDYYTGLRRESLNPSHWYGHDILLKRL